MDKNYIVNYVNKNLIERRNIKVQNEWLVACVQWLQEEHHQEKGISESKFKELVYEQWLMSDLREIGTTSLPENISNFTQRKLSGKFMLQVNYGYNIGMSAYSQLQKSKGLEIPAQQDEISNFSASTKSSAPQAKGKTSRVLFLELTDGINTIDAIEYQHVAVLKDQVTPGCKIELIGPVGVEDGILLLTPKNVSVLGGNCEELVNECTQGNILRSILSLEKEEDQTENKEKNEGVMAIENEQQPLQNEKENPTNVVLDEDEDFFNDDFNIDNNYDDNNHDEKTGGREQEICHDDNDELELILLNDDIDADLLDSPILSNHHNTTNQVAESKEDQTLNMDGYLADIKANKGIKSLKVKAYVVTLLSKLEMKNSEFQLDVCIDDGSAVCKAILSNQVLTSMIGFPAEYISAFKANLKPFSNEVQQAIVKFQQSLATKLWSMEVIQDNNGRLIVIQMSQL
eukprot:gene16692-18386_t